MLLKGQYLFHGPTGLRLHLVLQKDWPFSIVALNQSSTEISKHPTFCSTRYVVYNIQVESFNKIVDTRILLQEYNAKLSDFGLAKAGPRGDKTHVSTRVVGTYGYAAPEYVMTGKQVVKDSYNMA